MSSEQADLVIRFDSFNLIEFCDRLGDEFVLDRQMMVEGFTGSVRNVITYTPAGFQIEVFRLGDDPHHVERFAIRRRLRVPECSAEAWVAAPEDVVIHGVAAARRYAVRHGVPRRRRRPALPRIVRAGGIGHDRD